MSGMGQSGYSGGGSRGSVQFLANGAPVIGNMGDLSNYAAMKWNQWEFIEQSLYDSFSYPAAGVVGGSILFQVPQGSGTGFGGGVKSLSDTNMTNNGMLPSGQMQLVTSVELEFQVTTPTVTAGMPAVFGAQLAAVQINDAYIFWRSGNLVFKLLQKNYLTEAPLMRFPSTDDFSLQAALAEGTTLTTASQSRIGFAASYGQPYVLSPNNLLIPQTVNFQVTLGWPEGAQAITNPARVFCHLNGMTARSVQ